MVGGVYWLSTHPVNLNQVASKILQGTDMSQILSLTPVLFAIVSATWIYWHFLIRREGEPGTEIEINVDFVGQQKDKCLIEVSAILTNRSLVRHNYHDFQLKVRYLLPHDEVIDGGEKINFQLNFTRTIDERLGGRCRFFANATYIDPRLSFRHSYITSIPAEATFIWVQCKLLFPTKRHRIGWKRQQSMKNTQRLLKVPKEIVLRRTTEGQPE